MPVRTVKDLLTYLQKFHTDLSTTLQRVADRISEEKSRVILNYIAEQQKALERCLQECEAETDEAVVRTWLKFPPTLPECRCFDGMDWPENITPAEIVQRFQRIHSCLLQLYQRMADEAPTPDVREFFSELLQTEQSEHARVLAEALRFLEQS